jgi:hypothetical protein
MTIEHAGQRVHACQGINGRAPVRQARYQNREHEKAGRIESKIRAR